MAGWGVRACGEGGYVSLLDSERHAAWERTSPSVTISGVDAAAPSGGGHHQVLPTLPPEAHPYLQWFTTDRFGGAEAHTVLLYAGLARPSLYLLIDYLCSRPPPRGTAANSHVTVKTNHPLDQGTGAEPFFDPFATKNRTYTRYIYNGGRKIQLAIHYKHTFISQMNVISASTKFILQPRGIRYWLRDDNLS